MLKPKLILCAEGVVVDSNTNTISLFSIIEEIVTTELPSILAKLSVISVMEREANDPEAYELIFRLNNNKKELWTTSVTANFNGKYRARNVVVINGIPVEEPGELRFIITYQNNLFQEYVIPVQKAEILNES